MQMAEQTAESLLLHLEIDTNLVPHNFANKLNELATFYIEIDNLNKAKELFYRSLFIYEYELKNIQSKLIMPLSNLKYLHKIKEEKVQVFDIQNQLDQINRNIENWEMDSLQLFANQYIWFPEIRYFDLGLPEINQPNLINEEGIELANIGLKYLTEGFYSEALELLSQAVEIDPININYEFITQNIFSNKDSANVFLNYINNNENINQWNQQESLVIAAAGIKSKNYQKALDHLQKYIENFPNDGRGFLMIADVYAELNEWFEQFKLNKPFYNES